MKKPMNKSMIRKIIKGVAILFFVFYSIVITIDLIKQYRLKRVRIFATGYIINYKTDNKGLLELEYNFKIGNKIYTSQAAYPEIYSKNGGEFINKKFPVIYLPNNIGYNQILISRAAFRMYKVPFPDSLKWVTSYEK